MNWHTRIFYVCVLVAIIIGCRRSSEAGEKTVGSKLYFPSQVGSRWVYRITLQPDVEPLWLRVVRWPVGTRVAVQSVRGRFYGALTNKSKNEFRLVMTVESPSQRQGPLEYKEGAKLRIEEDELGVILGDEYSGLAVGDQVLGPRPGPSLWSLCCTPILP